MKRIKCCENCENKTESTIIPKMFSCQITHIKINLTDVCKKHKFQISEQKSNKLPF